MDRKYILTALGYALLGLALGIYMAASKNHSQLVTHAHIMLVGFVISFAYGIVHKLWINGQFGSLVKAQYYLHQLGTVILVVGLYLLYGALAPEAVVGPVLGIGSILVFVAMVLMKVLYIKASK